MVAAVHRVDLRERHMALVHEGYEIVREIVQQAEGALAGLTAVEIAAVVLYPWAVAHLLDHLEVVFHPLFQALGLEPPALLLEPLHLLHEVVLDVGDGGDAAFPGGHEVVGRADADLIELFQVGTGDRVDEAERIHLVSEEFYPHRLVGTAEEDVHDVAVHPEGSAVEIGFRAAVESIHELVQQAGQAAGLPFPHHDGLLVEIVGVAYAVEAAHAGHDDHVPTAGHQGAGGTQAQFFYLVVDAEVLLYVGVRSGYVRLRLVVIVVGHEILHGVAREKRLEFAVQLGCKGLVVAQDESRPLQSLDDVGHRESLSGSGDAEQGHVTHPALESGDQLRDGLRLVAGGFVIGFKYEFHLAKIRESLLYLLFYEQH